MSAVPSVQASANLRAARAPGLQFPPKRASMNSIRDRSLAVAGTASARNEDEYQAALQFVRDVADGRRSAEGLNFFQRAQAMSHSPSLRPSPRQSSDRRSNQAAAHLGEEEQNMFRVLEQQQQQQQMNQERTSLTHKRQTRQTDGPRPRSMVKPPSWK